MNKFCYYLCMCWFFGHKWRTIGDFSPEILSKEELEQYPTGYSCYKCTLCDYVAKVG